MAKTKRKDTSDRIQGRNRLPSKRKRMAERRLELRNQLWSDAEKVVWDRKNAVGFSTIPRLLPLIMSLLKQISSPGDPSSVYLDLWARQMDDGLVEVTNEEDFAYSSGYSGTRAARTWRERVDALEDLGLIRVKEKGVRRHGYILVLDPIQVCKMLRQESRSRVPDEWWVAFVARADEVGTEID